MILKRSCYYCQKWGLCFIRRGMEAFLEKPTILYLKVDFNEEPPLTWQALYDTLAQCCKEFKANPDE